MKEYNLYLPFQPTNGSGSWSWLEEVLTKQFGRFTMMTGEHLGDWNVPDITIEGKVRSYSVCGDERAARPFFKKLKRRMTTQGLAQFLIIEKEPPGPRGEPAGERI